MLNLVLSEVETLIQHLLSPYLTQRFRNDTEQIQNFQFFVDTQKVEQ